MPLHLLRHLANICRLVLIGGVAGYLAICLMLYLYQERLLFHPAVLPPDFVYPFSQPFADVTLPVDGATLSVVHFLHPSPRGVVLYLHGNAETLQHADRLAERFLHRGYAVMLFDYRGYGKSTGQITDEATLHQDAQAVYDYVRQHYRESQIVIYGHSLGTGLAVRLAAANTPHVLILESPYLSMQDLVARRFPYVPQVLLKYPLRSDRWIGQVRCPIYMLHGTEDTVIPYDSSERLLAYSTASTQLIRIDGGGHSDLATFATYQAALDRMLE